MPSQLNRLCCTAWASLLLVLFVMSGARAHGAPGLGRAAQPENAIEETDLRRARPELQIEAAETFTLPLDEFPEAVVIDLPGRKAYATTTVIAINIFSIAATVWLEALALLIAAPALWWFRRTLRRPQVIGREYCRRCNYELTNLPGERCPECGAVLRPRMRRRGRRRWPRLSIAALIFIAAAAAYAAFFRMAPRHIWPDHWPAWWSETLDDVAAANARYKWLIAHSSVLSRIHELDLDARGASRILWTGRRSDADHIESIHLSADGSRLGLWHSGFIRIWSLSEPRPMREIAFTDPLLAPLGGGARHVAFSADGREALIIGAAPDFIAMAIDLDASREGWRLTGDFFGDLQQWRILHGSDFGRFIIAGERPDTGETLLTEWLVDERQAPQLMRRFATSAYSLGPRLARHGFGPHLWASDFDQVQAWNLQTETVERRLTMPHPVALLCASPGGAGRLIITMFADESVTWIVEPVAGRVLAELKGEPLRVRSAEILADGRTLALWGYSGDFEHRVLHLYDLSRLDADVP